MAGNPLAVLPMELQVDDRFTDEEGDWEITGHPYTMREGKVVHATVQRPGEPTSAREKTWGAHEHLTTQRSSATPAPPSRATRASDGRAKGREKHDSPAR